jgi:hypothetical protein
MVFKLEHTTLYRVLLHPLGYLNPSRDTETIGHNRPVQGGRDDLPALADQLDHL